MKNDSSFEFINLDRQVVQTCFRLISVKSTQSVKLLVSNTIWLTSYENT